MEIICPQIAYILSIRNPPRPNATLSLTTAITVTVCDKAYIRSSRKHVHGNGMRRSVLITLSNNLWRRLNRLSVMINLLFLINANQYLAV